MEKHTKQKYTEQPPSVSAISRTEEVDVIQAAKDAIESLTPFAETQNIRLHLSTVYEKLIIFAMPGSFRVLFRSIIDNSIKYMDAPGHLIITLSLLGDDLFLILKNTPKELHKETFSQNPETDFQDSEHVIDNEPWLTQSKMIVEALGGTIYTKNSPENEMAIYIQIPVSKKNC